MPDEELAAAAEAPVEVVPALRGARSLVEAREYAQLVLEPQPVALGDDARPRSSGSSSCARPPPERLSLDEAKGDRPRAEGRRRRPARPAARADGRRSRPGARCGARRALARRGARPREPRGEPDYDRRRCACTTRSRARSSSCRRRPGRSACTSAGRPSTSAFTSATRVAVRAPAVAAQLAARDGLRGEARRTTSPTSTTRSTSRPGRERASSPRDAIGLVLRGHRSPRARPSRRRADRGRDDRRDQSRSSASSSSEAFAYESDGDVYFRVARLSRVRPAVAASGSTRSRSRSRTRARRIRATSRSGRRRSRARTRPGTRRGARAVRAGTSSARPCPRSTSGRSSRSTAAGSTSSFPHHENEIAQSRALGHPFAQLWMHNGMLDVRRRGDVKVASATSCRSADVLDRWGRETLLVFFTDRALAQAARLLGRRRMEAAAARAERFRDVFRAPSEAGAGGLRGSGSRPRSTTTSTRRRRSPCMHEWRDHELLRRRSASSGSSRSPTDDEAPPEVVALAEQRARGAGRARLRRVRSPSSRDRGGRLGRA